MEQPITPDACALLACVPLTFEDFLRDATDPQKDFISSVVKGRTSEKAWSNRYQQVVSVFERVEHVCLRSGVTVVRSASRASFGAAFQEHRVISLFAHSVMPSITEQDLRSPEQIAALILNSDTLTAGRLRELCHPTDLQQHGARLVAALVRDLNCALQRTQEAFQEIAPTEPVFNVTRVMLEKLLAPHIQPAAAIEFCDGLATFAEFATCVPENFDGVIDLTVCNSAMLGEPLKRMRPKCLVIENLRSATIDVRLAKYGLVVQALSRAPARFTDAVAAVNRQLIGMQ